MRRIKKDLRHFRRDKRGQARIIDFVIAFSLFILFIAQILVLMTSLQYQVILEEAPTIDQQKTYY